MALSGTFYTNVGSGWRLQLEWSATQDIANNKSTITAKLYWMSLGSSYTVNSSATKDGAITIDGTTDTFSGAGLASLSGNQKKLLSTFTKTVTHNSDGTKSVSLSAYFDAEVTLSGTYYGRISVSGTATLNTIPRESTLTSSPSWTAGNSLPISIDRKSSSYTHTVKVYVNNTLIKTVTGIGTSTTINFSTTENTNIFTQLAQSASKSTKITLETYNGGTLIGSNDYTGTCTAPNASTLTAPSSFNIGDTISITINRSNSNFTHTIKLKNGSNVAKTYTNQTTSTSFATSDVASTLYGWTPNSNSINLTLECTTYYNGVQVRTPTTKTITANVINSNPTFGTGYTYKDTNSTTTAITGNDQYIIQNKSTVVVEIPTSAKATAVNGASMVEYTATLNGVSITQPYSSSATVTFNFGTVNASSNLTLSVTARDSRGNTTTTTKTITIVPYSNPVVNTSATRANNFDNNTTIKLSGSFSLLNIGGTNKNSIQSMQYRYKESASGTWGSWTNFAYTTNSGTYTATDVVLNLDNTKSYNIEVKVQDKLATVTIPLTVASGKPIFFIDSGYKSVSINKFPTGSGVLEVDGNIDVINGNIKMNNGSVEILGGGNVTVRNPNNSGASVNLSWQNDIARIRYGGTGAGSSGGFQIQGAGDIVKFSVDNNGNGEFAGGLKLNGQLTFTGATNVIDTGSSSGAIIDQYGNIKAKSTMSSGGYWHLDNVDGTQLIKVYWGSSPSGIEISPQGGALSIIGNGGWNTKLVGTDHVYIQFYSKGTGQPRSGYLGYGSAGTNTMTLYNEIGDLQLRSYGGSTFTFKYLGGHNGLQGAGRAHLKWLSSGDVIQIRNSSDSAYAEIQASAFTVASKREFKTNIKEFNDSALDKVKSTKIYKYNYKNEVEKRDENGNIISKKSEKEAKKLERLGLIYEESPQELKQAEDGIDLYSMTAILWKAVQELSEQVDYLKDKIKR
jgi:Siphovirus protein of unknown function (DUF859)/Chaperone of endosialidase